jgi:serine protease Do
VGLACLAACAASAAPAVASELRRTATVRAVEQVRSSVVNIHGQKNLAPNDDGFRPGETPQRVNGMGTGIIIDERGYIITNFHVVDGVLKIIVTTADEQNFTAKMISHDAKTDLAIVKIDPPANFKVISIGTSSDLLTGEEVIAVGNAFGYEHTVTRGIISALHRTVQVSDTQNYEDLIQTDASINPGNSGGPLLNIDGEMIGINVAVRAGAQGIGFAIPVDAAMVVAARLMSVERLDNTWHGVVPRSGAAASVKQFVVGEIDADSPAGQSGIQAGDVITSAGGASIVRALDFERALLGHKAGDEVQVMLQRKGHPLKVALVLAVPPHHPIGTDRTWELIGMKLEPISPKQLKPQSRYHGGLLVTAVKPDGPAAHQGIRRGDILVGMHIWETTKLADVAYVLSRPDFTEIEPVKFYIVRGTETLYGHLRVSLEQ